MLCGEDHLVRVGGGVPGVWVEECRLVDAAAVQRVVFCDSSHLFLVDDKRKTAGLPVVSTGFESRRDRCDCSNEFVNWHMLGRSCDSWERVRIKAGSEHCVDGGGTCFRHGERVVGLRHAIK